RPIAASSIGSSSRSPTRRCSRACAKRASKPPLRSVEARSSSSLCGGWRRRHPSRFPVLAVFLLFVLGPAVVLARRAGDRRDYAARALLLSRRAPLGRSESEYPAFHGARGVGHFRHGPVEDEPGQRDARGRRVEGILARARRPEAAAEEPADGAEGEP